VSLSAWSSMRGANAPECQRQVGVSGLWRAFCCCFLLLLLLLLILRPLYTQPRVLMSKDCCTHSTTTHAARGYLGVVCPYAIQPCNVQGSTRVRVRPACHLVLIHILSAGKRLCVKLVTGQGSRRSKTQMLHTR